MNNDVTFSALKSRYREVPSGASTNMCSSAMKKGAEQPRRSIGAGP